MTPDITLTLNPAADKSCTVEQVVPERKLRCGQPMHHPGGGGINVSRAIEGASQIHDVARSLIDDGKTQVVVTSLGSGGVALTTLFRWAQALTKTSPIQTR
jgi:fructose-1-phosphate kinase PfkB-like protein